MVNSKKVNQKKYYEIWESDTYKAEIYDNCTASFQVRGDGLRARLIYDTTTWDGNTGGFVQKTEYWDGRENVKKIMKELRTMQKKSIKNGEGKKDWSIGFALVGDYRFCY